METKSMPVPNDWVDMVSYLSLVVDTTYVIDITHSGSVFLWESATKPTGSLGHPIIYGKSRMITVGANPIWISSNSNADIVITEV